MLCVLIVEDNDNDKLTKFICDGRFYYDKSTKTLYKYLHDRLEIKDIRCIHQGREKKERDSHFLSLNNLILNWKKGSAYVPF